jgi:RNA polymerase sigma-70 factor (ECF subfamily)
MLSVLLTIEDLKIRSKLEEIYVCYHKELFITAYDILKDYHEAEDIVQTMIIRLSKNIDKITDIKCKKTKTYLIVIVRNLCYDAYNRKTKITSMPIDEMSNIAIEDNERNLDDHILRIEKSSEMIKKLSKLYPPYADILMLKYYHQLSITEIAETLGITENNVSVKINRALKALKGIFEEGSELIERKI